MAEETPTYREADFVGAIIEALTLAKFGIDVTPELAEKILDRHILQGEEFYAKTIGYGPANFTGFPAPKEP